MSDIDNDDIRRVDGGLLLVFRELLVRGRASEAAKRLGLSQSAISHALTRLRDLFGDPLFIRRPHGLQPTSRALELGPRVEALIDLVRSTIAAEGRFNPRQSRRVFNLATPEFVISLIGGDLLRRLQAQAPQASFTTRRLLVDPALSAVARGEIDLALGQFVRVPAQLSVETLYEDSYCVIARKGHPTIKRRIDLENYALTGHITVGHPTPGAIDELIYDASALAAAYGSIPDPNLVRTVAYVSQWEAAMLLVSRSDALADCPRRLALRYAKQLGLQVIDPPYEAMTVAVQMVGRASLDPGTAWLAEEIRSAAR